MTFRFINRPVSHLALAIAVALIAPTFPAGAEDAPKADAKGPLELAFADLRFKTSAPKQIKREGSDLEMPTFNDQIPEKIRGLNAKRVRIHGFMMPTVLDEKKGVKEFVIVMSQLACCYGQTPDVNEYIIVKMVEGKSAPLLENVPLTFEGILKVGDIYENGYWTGMYALECDDVHV